MDLSIHHIALSIGSIKRSLPFYTALGFTEERTWTSEIYSATVTILQKDHLRLELWDAQGDRGLPIYRQNQRSELKALGTKYIGLSTPDIETTHEHLLKKGLRVSELRTREDDTRYALLHDPDGILIELIEHKKSSS